MRATVSTAASTTGASASISASIAAATASTTGSIVALHGPTRMAMNAWRNAWTAGATASTCGWIAAVIAPRRVGIVAVTASTAVGIVGIELVSRQADGRMLDRVTIDVHDDLRTARSTPAGTDVPAALEAVSLEQFLADIGVRAFRFAELGLRQRDDALDVVQDAMLKMLAYRERPSTEWTPLFWSILRSRIVDLQRRRMFRLRWLAPQHGADAGAIDWADAGPDPARHNDGREAWARITEALRALPRRQREAFTLRIFEELDVASTARVMGCSEGSVKTHLSRARDALQRQLEEFR